MLTNEAWKRTSSDPGLHYFDCKHAETASIPTSVKPATMLCLFGPSAPEHAQGILYGGGVKTKNVARLFARPDFDGGLIGSASLVVEELLPFAGRSIPLDFSAIPVKNP